MKKYIKQIIIALMIVLVIVAAVYYGRREKTVDYAEHIDDVAATVDGQPITFADCAMYVAYEERQIEEQARIYNPDSPKDYWNMHVDGIFIGADARKTALGMAVHDYLFYNLAVENGMTLTEEEEEYLSNEITDFWEDLYDEQIERMPVSEDVINTSIRHMALAQKYQQVIAEENDRTYHEYDWDGYDYEKWLEANHKVKKKAIWNKIKMGEITLTHDSVSYINGLTDEERQEIQDNKKK